MSAPRIVLTTGGTGGHIFPALAVAEELKARGAELLFVGGTYGPEGDLARKAGLAFAGLPVRGLVGRGLKAVAGMARLALGLGKALLVLSRFKPQAIAGFGGYASFCPLAAAGVLGVPAVLHEQNSVPGVATRALARVAKTVCVSFPDNAGVLPASKLVLTGNPVRGVIRDLGGRERPSREPGRLLVLGGSQGAKALNDAVVRDLEPLKGLGLEILHQSGPRQLEDVRAAYAAAGVNGRVEAFLDDMAAAYQWADVALCRAGATTLAELAVAGLPSVLVPFPQATHDHQAKNAQAMAEAGAAVLLPQAQLGGTRLDAVLKPLLNAQTLAGMSAAARTVGRPDAAAKVADEIYKLIGVKP